MAQRGRPTKYTRAIADKICILLAGGRTLRSICRDETDANGNVIRASPFPAEATVRNWAVLDHDGFFARYARARDMGIDSIVDETIEIADTVRENKSAVKRAAPCTFTRSPVQDDPDCVTCGKPNGHPNHVALVEVHLTDGLERSRLMVDTRKWYAAKMAPKRYSDRPPDASEGEGGKAGSGSSFQRRLRSGCAGTRGRRRPQQQSSRPSSGANVQ